MCTVTVVPHAAGIRLMSNRDERRSRAAASPPAWRRIGSRQALFPLDAQAGGTWVGANDAGVAVALLNRMEAADLRSCPSPATGWRSRGAIVPLLLTATGLREVIRRARRIQRAHYRPFRVLAVCEGAAVVITAGPRDFREVCLRLDAPLLLTSSSLGDVWVDPPRRRLFASMMNVPAGDWLAAQRRFHGHRWPTCPELSVMMARPDARTVSRTTCDLTHDRQVCMTHEPIDDVASVRLAS